MAETDSGPQKWSALSSQIQRAEHEFAHGNSAEAERICLELIRSCDTADPMALMDNARALQLLSRIYTANPKLVTVVRAQALQSMTAALLQCVKQLAQKCEEIEKGSTRERPAL